MAYSVLRGEHPSPDRTLAWRESTAFHREVEWRRCLLVIVILDSSICVLDLINIPYIGNIISSPPPQLYYTDRQLFHQQPFVKLKRDQIYRVQPSGFFLS